MARVGPFVQIGKIKIEVVVLFVEVLYNTNIKVHGYTKAHFSLKNIKIKLIAKYEICTEKDISLILH